ncbi:uncharacterized protein NEMAJ01_0121 [Nematocida major]|uniref:uncharacterized protein n=1 Tax=Nematocida major TaxID=1912982 RepID=UPI0020082315|nr:uncharacterized protein NEMAJ01_0121 [Nematocida major]KAH9385225.1 hypothetical protein NEMAJ01_0121 [Nematocida major]
MERRELFNIQINTNEYEEQQSIDTKEKKRPKKIISKKKISLYKTEICKSFENSNFCTYGDKCQFAHSLSELRDIERHPRYKTELCKTYTIFGECTYGKRCCFIHAGPSEDKHTDLQDARNIPGDWKIPGVHASEIEMNSIEEEEAAKNVGSLLGLEDLKKIKNLAAFKIKPSFAQHKPLGSALSNIPPEIFIGPRHSSSNIWVKPHFCFIFVDSSSRVSHTIPLGKSPGSISHTKDYSK